MLVIFCVTNLMIIVFKLKDIIGKNSAIKTSDLWLDNSDLTEIGRKLKE